MKRASSTRLSSPTSGGPSSLGRRDTAPALTNTSHQDLVSPWDRLPTDMKTLVWKTSFQSAETTQLKEDKRTALTHNSRLTRVDKFAYQTVSPRLNALIFQLMCPTFDLLSTYVVAHFRCPQHFPHMLCHAASEGPPGSDLHRFEALVRVMEYLDGMPGLLPDHIDWSAVCQWQPPNHPGASTVRFHLLPATIANLLGRSKPFDAATTRNVAGLNGLLQALHSFKPDRAIPLLVELSLLVRVREGRGMAFKNFGPLDELTKLQAQFDTPLRDRFDDLARILLSTNEGADRVDTSTINGVLEALADYPHCLLGSLAEALTLIRDRYSDVADSDLLNVCLAKAEGDGVLLKTPD